MCPVKVTVRVTLSAMGGAGAGAETGQASYVYVGQAVCRVAVRALEVVRSDVSSVLSQVSWAATGADVGAMAGAGVKGTGRFESNRAISRSTRAFARST